MGEGSALRRSAGPLERQGLHHRRAVHGPDAVLLGDRLVALAEAFVWARETRRIVRQNLTWAVLYNLTALPLAACGYVAPYMAAIGMSASSLLVVANALRLGRVRVSV